MTDYPAFTSELKFLISAKAADVIRAWARLELSADPNAVGFGGDGYQTTSLYFDTPNLDLFYRRGSHARAKFRVRSYNDGEAVFLERKMKANGRVLKRRTDVTGEDLTRLEHDFSHWPGRWFARRLERRGLKPVCQISYSRTARVGASPAGPVRVTIDERLSVAAIDKIALSIHNSMEFTPGYAILELKYREETPPLFQRLIDEFGLDPQPMSKYRLAVRKLGLAREDEALVVHAG